MLLQTIQSHAQRSAQAVTTCGTSISYGSQEIGAITDQFIVCTYRFSGNKDDIVTIRAARVPGSELDTVVKLLHPINHVLRENDDINTGNTDSEILRFRLPNTGDYHIEVTSYAGRSRGHFSLSLQLIPPTPTPTRTPNPTPTPTPTRTPTPLHTPSAPTSSVPQIGWVRIPGGSFLMGSDAAGIQTAVNECNVWEGNCQADWFNSELRQDRRVILPEYEIMRYEVTNAQYTACVDAGVCSRAGREISDSNIAYDASFFASSRPVVGVSYEDASKFCSWLGARVPTEEEWEKAARGTDGRLYPWGDYLDLSRANLNSGDTANVGSYAAGVSPYGIHDMAGNAFEWTSSRQGGQYVLRGGSWASYPHRARTADRGTRLSASFANYDIGFRCVR